MYDMICKWFYLQFILTDTSSSVRRGTRQERYENYERGHRGSASPLFLALGFHFIIFWAINHQIALKTLSFPSQFSVNQAKCDVRQYSRQTVATSVTVTHFLISTFACYIFALLDYESYVLSYHSEVNRIRCLF